MIAIGANLPGPDGAPPLETCRRAAAALDGLPGLCLQALSRWWATEAFPPRPESPRYINGMARLAPRAGCAAPDPVRLLRALQEIEARFGRVRPYPDAPRTLDLDLIDLDGLVRDAPDPVLPHPRAHMRLFVLGPLADVAPGWVHPRLGQGVQDLLAGLGPQDASPMG